MYFSKHRVTIEIDENGHNDRNVDYEITRQKAIEKELDCEFIRINSDGKDLLKSILILLIYWIWQDIQSH